MGERHDLVREADEVKLSAEVVSPGTVRQVLDAELAAAVEPTKAAVRDAILYGGVTIPHIACRPLSSRYELIMSMDVDRETRRGRPKVESELVSARIAQPLLGQLDVLRDAQADQPMRPEVVRRLLADSFLQNDPRQ